MKFQNPSFNFFLNGRTNGRTNKQTDKRKAICSPLFQSWGHKKISFILFFNFQKIGSGGSVKRKIKKLWP